MSKLIPTRQELPKYVAALEAVKRVESDMRIGLGTGSTAAWFVKLLGERIAREKLKIIGTTTSSMTQAMAQELNIPLCSLDEIGELDFVVDGADEVDHELCLIKGGGAALLQEKIVANASKKMIVIADDSKFVKLLGKFHLPVEVVKFGWATTQKNIEAVLSEDLAKSSKTSLRMHLSEPVETDEGHYIIDCHCESIKDSAKLEVALNMIPGVVENGLFIDLATEVILGKENGKFLEIDSIGGIRDDVPLQLDFDIEELD